MTSFRTEPDIASVLAHRRWWFADKPFPYFHSRDVFTARWYEQLEGAHEHLLAKGLSDELDGDRLSRNMPGTDAFGWNLPPRPAGALGMFYDQNWHDLVARLTGVHATGDVSCAVHHHLPGSAAGRVHRDLGVGWFPGASSTGVVNPADRSHCSYIYGDTQGSGADIHEAVRAVTMIFYLANPPWVQGDGGETGLYRRGTDAVGSPVVRIAPVNNSLVIFENTPWAFHAFMSNIRSPRNSIVLWLHRTIDEAQRRFGKDALYRWRRAARPPSRT